MPTDRVTESLLLPELRLVDSSFEHDGEIELDVDKTSAFEVCPKCATPSRSVYDHRVVSIHDAPVRSRQVRLRVRKRRFSCRPCGKPFTEPVGGIRKGARHTERYRKSVLWACENFSSLKDVRRAYRCSSGFLYTTLYAELERRRRTRIYPWPKVVGIDEHFFRRENGFPRFVSVLVDYKGRRVMELVNGRSGPELEAALALIPGRENVRYVVLDLSDPFKRFTQSFFPNAQLVADKFHVLRLLNPAINRYRKAITGDRRSLPIRRLLLRSGHRLHHAERYAVERWLELYPQLQELYLCKEALHRFYRTRGFDRAAEALTWLTDQMARSAIPEIQTLRRTLMRWRREVLAYFKSGLTNGRTEGFNNKAKLVKKRAYGYRSFENYRLRLLNACA